MAFENISKGKVFDDEMNVYDDYGNGICYCPKGRGNSDANAKFISYCFNLQQRYDISKLEEAIKLLESYLNSDMKDMEQLNNIDNECQKLLKQIKK